MAALSILSCSAVTAAGLDAFQTCAAIRARISGFRACVPRTPPQEPLIAGKIPTHSSLRRTYLDWLVNMGSRGLREVLPANSTSSRLGLVLSLSESFRECSGVEVVSALEFVSRLESRLQLRFARKSAMEEGGGGSIRALAYAHEMLSSGDVDLCVVGGVDSLLNARDLSRLQKSHRLHEAENPDGFIAGEGAAFVLVSRAADRNALAEILGVGSATESNSVVSSRYSQGAGLVAAMRQAVHDSDLTEADVCFRVSNSNAEHYAAWEASIAVPRFYRSRRERLPVWYAAASVGDTGAASGALAVVVAALAIAGGYAPGPYGMCEAASEQGLRAASLIGPARGAVTPPFRPGEGASRHILERQSELQRRE